MQPHHGALPGGHPGAVKRWDRAAKSRFFTVLLVIRAKWPIFAEPNSYFLYCGVTIDQSESQIAESPCGIGCVVALHGLDLHYAVAGRASELQQLSGFPRGFRPSVRLASPLRTLSARVRGHLPLRPCLCLHHRTVRRAAAVAGHVAVVHEPFAVALLGRPATADPRGAGEPRAPSRRWSSVHWP